MEGRDSQKAYKKIANEGKRVRFFYIETEIKRALDN